MCDNTLIPLRNTTFMEFFEDIECKDIFLLSKDGANRLWNSYFDKNAKSYFSLPDDNWVISGKKKLIGTWLEAYNCDNNQAVSSILRKEITWRKSQVIWFCVSKEIIFQSHWHFFLKHWDCFVAVEEDCPIVVSQESNQKLALLFRPIGDMYKITH